MNKYKMYVSITDLTCSHIPNLSSNEFKVELEPAIARIFTKLFNQINGLEGHNLWRAHLPYIPYHYDELNHDIDTRLKKFMRYCMNSVIIIRRNLLSSYHISSLRDKM